MKLKSPGKENLGNILSTAAFLTLMHWEREKKKKREKESGTITKWKLINDWIVENWELKQLFDYNNLFYLIEKKKES